MALMATGGTLAACASVTAGTTHSPCRSHYSGVVDGRTWRELAAVLRGSTRWGEVTRIRIQAQGRDIGAGNRPAVRVVDLVDGRGQRLVQADVWRTPEAPYWHAGVWLQCTD